MSNVQLLQVQDPFLNALRRKRIPVAVYLINGIKLQGQIESFDQFVVLLKNNGSQMVYKNAISSIVPTRSVKLKNLSTDLEFDQSCFDHESEEAEEEDED